MPQQEDKEQEENHKRYNRPYRDVVDVLQNILVHSLLVYFVVSRLFNFDILA
jgi:hypothetical protein